LKGIAFVDRAFAIEFATELHELWIIQDSYGAVHYVNYNMNLLCPVINDGWSDLVQSYEFQGHHSIIFRYVGGNYFHIHVYKGWTILYRLDHSLISQ